MKPAFTLGCRLAGLKSQVKAGPPQRTRSPCCLATSAPLGEKDEELDRGK